MKLSLLIDDLIINQTEDIEISHLSFDPKNCVENALLFLINENAKKEYQSYMPAVSAIICENTYLLNTNTPVFYVKNIRSSISKAFYNMYCGNLSRIKFIGITGTNGKSTTAIMIKKVLCDCGFCVGLFGTGKIMIGDKIISNTDYSMTTPTPDVLYPSIQKMKDAGADFIIMEVSSHALMQERVSPLNFDIGIFTNMSPEHLDYHHNMDNYYMAKAKLMKKSKKIVVNSDDKYGQQILASFNNSESCGASKLANTRIGSIREFGFNGCSFLYSSPDSTSIINLAIPGIYNVHNATLAIRALEILEIPLSKTRLSLESIKTLDGRFEIVHKYPTIIIDYAHTIAAFENIAKSLYTNKNTRQKLIFLFGCGGNRDAGKRAEMGKIANLYADEIILTSDNPRNESPESIIEEIAQGISKTTYKYIDRKDAIRFSIKLASENDIIAIIGKGPEKYTIINGEYSDFDEKSIIQEALSERDT